MTISFEQRDIVIARFMISDRLFWRTLRFWGPPFFPIEPTDDPRILILGCFCDAGHVRSGNNCIKNSKCFSSCALDNGVELAIGQSHMNADCSQTCTCVENYFDSTQPPSKFLKIYNLSLLTQ